MGHPYFAQNPLLSLAARHGCPKGGGGRSHEESNGAAGAGRRRARRRREAEEGRRGHRRELGPRHPRLPRLLPPPAASNFPDRCHSCSMTTGYNRCHIIEHVVDSTKVSCFYGNLGCTEKITYYEREDHEKVCPHGPCFCPETDCSFCGSTVMLHEHFA
ncbi:hypothetical protein C2845_PM07G02720 [Panicum miliaceum]|uniref:SIAH-type domain-containing protein n=1 Tax=Panicum miliaceum TaxID=4540 RepID=A0A3L6SRK5_PANMI|nr:hypothetical protein C2845_PM07G02720 [Panicum miliaceum]